MICFLNKNNARVTSIFFIFVRFGLRIFINISIIMIIISNKAVIIFYINKKLAFLKNEKLCLNNSYNKKYQIF